MGSIIQIFNVITDSITLYKEVGFDRPIVNYHSKTSYVINPACPVGMWSVKTTDDYIYTLYSGEKLKDLTNNKNALLANYVYVFDWDLNPVKSYKIKGGRVVRLAIDQGENRAYIASLSE